MINLATIRNSLLAFALGLLVFAEVFHPAFHNQYTRSSHEYKCLAAGKSSVMQSANALAYVKQKVCLICSCLFLKYCASASTPPILYYYQNTMVLPPLPDFIFDEISLPDSPRAPPVLPA